MFLNPRSSTTTFVFILQHSLPHPTIEAHRKNIQEDLEDWRRLGQKLKARKINIDAVISPNSRAHQTAEVIVGDSPREVIYIQMGELYLSSDDGGKAFLASCKEDWPLGHILSEIDPQILVVGHPAVLSALAVQICEERCKDEDKEEAKKTCRKIDHGQCEALVVQFDNHRCSKVELIQPD